jgi:short subunit dehydrogenase-like uncharacterized protein
VVLASNECAVLECSLLLQVEAAVRNGTHYCDIAGEVHFMRRTAERLHAEAQAKKVKIVHSCGFDSVPSDLGAHMLVEVRRHRLRSGSVGCSVLDGLATCVAAAVVTKDAAHSVRKCLIHSQSISL